jgi:hypothetical protein
MSLTKNAEIIYTYLRKVVFPYKRVITYGELSDATEIPLGEAGGPVRIALYEIFNACDNQKVPPITSIVVQQANLYDPSRRYGMPGGGYLVAEAQSPNLSKRCRDKGWEDWKLSPRPSDIDTWRMKEMIEAHQDSVWNFKKEWPEIL